MVIRPATVAEVPDLVLMGQHFLAQTPYQDVIADNPQQMQTLATQLLTCGAAGTILVAEDRGGALVGMIGLVVAPHFLSGELAAGEVFWWVEPEHRGAGLRLLKAAEQWATDAGAVSLQMIAPDDRLGALYARRGYQLVERSYLRKLEKMEIPDIPEIPNIPQDAARILVFDDVLPDPAAYRQQALAQPFGDVTVGAATFHGIAPAPDRQLLDWMTDRFGDCGTVTTFCRLSPAGQPEPNFIHTDCDMGAWTAICYLTAEPAEGDGTTFWRDRQTDQIESTSSAATEALTWRDRVRWEPWHTVAAKPNRIVIFPATYYHSRALYDNYGDTPDQARLIQVLFGGSDVGRH